MKINRNMSAVLTNNQLLRTEDKLAASMERLSSGYKINSPGDNPAGIAISNKMRAQIDALDQAEQNASDGVSVVQIADGALNEITDILQRMRELSVQAANGTNSQSDKESIQTEIDELKKEVDRISSDTEYNTKTLLDGSSDTRVYCDSATRMNISDGVDPGLYQFEVESLATQMSVDVTLSDPITGSGSIVINNSVVEVSAGESLSKVMNDLRTAAEENGCELTINGNTVTFTSELYGSQAELNVTVPDSLASDFTFGVAASDHTDEGYVYNLHGEDAQVSGLSLYNEETGTYDALPHTLYSANGNHVYITNVDGFSMDFKLDSDITFTTVNGVQQPYYANMEVTDLGSMTIQIGANEYQTMDVRIPEISTESMYLDELDVTAYNGAERGLTLLDEALEKTLEVRSRIGAFQNRLDYASSSLSETVEDTTAAYSRIMDTDMAEEMTNYTQLNVLDQASISVLSQANDLPEQILSLLA